MVAPYGHCSAPLFHLVLLLFCPRPRAKGRENGVATQRLKPTISSRSARRDCTHHWVLPEHTGKSVIGVCKRCGAERKFPVSQPLGFLRRSSPD